MYDLRERERERRRARERERPALSALVIERVLMFRVQDDALWWNLVHSLGPSAVTQASIDLPQA